MDGALRPGLDPAGGDGPNGRMKTAIPALFAILAGWLAVAPVAAFGDGVSASGLPLPRFVSLRGHEVNLRAGPGLQYPIEWVYRRQGLPLEIVAEYKTWRRVRDWQGDQGWVHQSMLAGKRTFLIINADQTLRAKPDVEARAVAILSEGVVGELSACPKTHSWCEVDVDGYGGWVPRGTIWGLLDGETLN